MTEPAIRIDGLWKEYVIGGRQRASGTFREVMTDVLKAPFRRLAGRGDASVGEERFWALKDVSLDIAPGEVVGIIGRNGAGKSTLLKILSRITAPTKGEVVIKGRVASLLEVGTGFHPELTGRENVFLNGAILGMSRAEIRAKFDEIVDFAGVDRFIDTPVKRYSSGMQVRLAFAVAAHLEPEILLVDEVLAVGDAEFQKKCLGKMSDISTGAGRTVLFVSHQLGMISRLCPRTILMQSGHVAFSGGSHEAMELYLSAGDGERRRNLEPDDSRISHLSAAILGSWTATPDGIHTTQFGWQSPIRVGVDVSLKRKVGQLQLGIGLENRHNTRVATWVCKLGELSADAGARLLVELEIPKAIIAPGGYSFVITLFDPGPAVIHHVQGEAAFSITDTGSPMAEFANIDYGVVQLPGQWSVSEQSKPVLAGEA